MSVLNGRLPATALAPVPFQTTRLLRADAAADLARLNSLHRAAFGFDMHLNDAYRDYDTQVAYKERTRLPSWHPAYLRFASAPGTSVHGWGLAVDIGSLGGFGSPRHKWLTKTAPAFGWHQPAQYQADGRYPEPWHWEFDPARVVDRPVTSAPEVNVPDVSLTLPDPLTEEPPMQYLVRKHDRPEVWLCDGIRRRWIQSEAELKDVLYWLEHRGTDMGKALAADGGPHIVHRLDTHGAPIGTEPD